MTTCSWLGRKPRNVLTRSSRSTGNLHQTLIHKLFTQVQDEKRRIKPPLTDCWIGEKEGARIIVCVDMLGEGFDLPNLKVAALHDTHKSLAVTLQFIGRFTRKGAVGKIGEATVVVNIADPETERKLTNLYAEGADWDVIIKQLSEERIEDELRLQDVVLRLKETGNLHSQLSLWNLRPALSTQIYKTICEGLVSFEI